MRGNFFAELKRSNVYKAHQCQKGSDPAVQPMRNQLFFREFMLAVAMSG
jgi:hypothetical protein